MSDTPLFGGTLLDTPEKEAQALTLGPQHVAVCESCGQRFYRVKDKTTICWGCWYSLEMATAENSFKPLSTWLERLLETETHVDQTGGMTMCLRVDTGRDVDVHGNSRRYVYFSDGIGDPDGFGYYRHDEDGDPIDDGVMYEWPMEFDCKSGDCRWYKHPEFSEQVAKWAAPIIVRLAAGEEVEP